MSVCSTTGDILITLFGRPNVLWQQTRVIFNDIIVYNMISAHGYDRCADKRLAKLKDTDCVCVCLLCRTIIERIARRLDISIKCFHTRLGSGFSMGSALGWIGSKILWDLVRGASNWSRCHGMKRTYICMYIHSSVSLWQCHKCMLYVVYMLCKRCVQTCIHYVHKYFMIGHPGWLINSLRKSS